MDISNHTSHRLAGVDTNGEICRLGEIDTDGYFVGYIDEGGFTWESRAERDRAIGAGRCFEAWVAWRNEGARTAPPDYMQILIDADVLPEHQEDALEEFRFTIMMRRWAEGC